MKILTIKRKGQGIVLSIPISKSESAERQTIIEQALQTAIEDDCWVTEAYRLDEGFRHGRRPMVLKPFRVELQFNNYPVLSFLIDLAVSGPVMWDLLGNQMQYTNSPHQTVDALNELFQLYARDGYTLVYTGGENDV